MDNFIAIKSNLIAFDEGKLLTKENINGTISVPGRLLIEGEDPEDVCRNEILNSKIIKPLHPKISWVKQGNLSFPLISLNYLTRVENV